VAKTRCGLDSRICGIFVTESERKRPYEIPELKLKGCIKRICVIVGLNTSSGLDSSVTVMNLRLP
jgi:hypothetical protein